MSTASVAYSAMKAMVRRIDIDIRASLSGRRARQIFLCTYYRLRGAGAYKRSVKAAEPQCSCMLDYAWLAGGAGGKDLGCQRLGEVCNQVVCVLEAD